MKKKWMTGLICAVLAASLVGCGGKPSNEYITIEKYEGLEVEKAEPPEVTDDMVESYVDKALSYYQDRVEVTDRPAQEGDTVNMD